MFSFCITLNLIYTCIKIHTLQIFVYCMFTPILKCYLGKNYIVSRCSMPLCTGVPQNNLVFLFVFKIRL